ncbi:RNA polymerase sigma-70 factor [Puteibacter caeruleilacunae]|nr:RNA polymerase sigma-70 factor [Puteibacter caeruleilacunae]
MNSDSRLILSELANGNSRIVGFLFDKYYHSLCRYAYSMIHNLEESRDLVQEVYLKIWERRMLLPSNVDIENYLYRAVKNGCLDYLKSAKVRQTDKAAIPENLLLVVEDQSDPKELENLRNTISEAVNSLPKTTHQIYQMHRTQGIKYREIAEELNISIKTVEKHMSAALKHLRTTYYLYRRGVEGFVQ